MRVGVIDKNSKFCARQRSINVQSRVGSPHLYPLKDTLPPASKVKVLQGTHFAGIDEGVYL